MTTTAIDKVYNALVNRGELLSAKQIASRFKVANPRDLIYRLRNVGVAVELVTVKGAKGTTVQKYKATKPSKR